MPIISYPQTPLKASLSSVNLDKAELLNNQDVSQDPYFSNQGNWEKVIVFMRSKIGNQKIQYIFDATETSPSTQFITSDKARDEFEVTKLVINDFDGGSLTLTRDKLNIADFDFSFALEEFFAFASTENGELKKVDGNGDEVWSVQNGGASFPKVVTDPQGNSYVAEGGRFGTQTGKIFKYDSNGNEVASVTGPIEGISALAVDSAGFVYVAFLNQEVRKMDLDLQTTVWTYSLSNEASSIVLDTTGSVYIASSDLITQLDSNGDLVREDFQGHNVSSLAVDDSGFLYYGGQFGNLEKLDASNGSTVIDYSSPSSNVTDLAFSGDGSLFAYFQDQTIRKFDVSGAQVWSTSVSGTFRSIDVDKNGFSYLGGDNFNKYDPSGTLVWSFTGFNGVIDDVALEPGRFGAGFWS